MEQSPLLSPPAVVDNTSTSIEAGLVVYVDGLIKQTQLNGRLGIVAPNKQQREAKNGRIVVVLIEEWAECMFKEPTQQMIQMNGKSLKRDNLVVIESARKFPSGKTPTDNCNGCGLPFVKKYLSLCSKCKRASYCSKDCQVSHWQVHKNECANLRKSRKDKTSDLESITGWENRIAAREARRLRFANAGDYAAAERELLSLKDEFHLDNPSLYDTLGVYAQAQGNDEQALQYALKGIQFPITDADRKSLAGCYVRQSEMLWGLKRDLKASAAAISKALVIDPQNESVLARLQLIQSIANGDKRS